MSELAAASGSGKRVLLALFVLFIGGFVVAYLMVEGGWRPRATKNYGELVQPARAVPDALFADRAGRAVRFSEFKGKWVLVYFGSAECLQPCIDNLYKMRQLTAAQGREGHRVKQVFVVTDPRARDVLRYTLADYPETNVRYGSADAVRELARPFALAPGTPLDGLHRLYVVDPLGNFMMSYPADADLRRMNEDLQWLLRASHIG